MRAPEENAMVISRTIDRLLMATFIIALLKIAIVFRKPHSSLANDTCENCELVLNSCQMSVHMPYTF
jgi:hypothetical protein